MPIARESLYNPPQGGAIPTDRQNITQGRYTNADLQRPPQRRSMAGLYNPAEQAQREQETFNQFQGMPTEPSTEMLSAQAQGTLGETQPSQNLLRMAELGVSNPADIAAAGEQARMEDESSLMGVAGDVAEGVSYPLLATPAAPFASAYLTGRGIGRAGEAAARGDIGGAGLQAGGAALGGMPFIKSLQGLRGGGAIGGAMRPRYSRPEAFTAQGRDTGAFSSGYAARPGATGGGVGGGAGVNPMSSPEGAVDLTGDIAAMARPQQADLASLRARMAERSGGRTFRNEGGVPGGGRPMPLHGQIQTGQMSPFGGSRVQAEQMSPFGAGGQPISLQGLRRTSPAESLGAMEEPSRRSVMSGGIGGQNEFGRFTPPSQRTPIGRAEYLPEESAVDLTDDLISESLSPHEVARARARESGLIRR